jgi:hypothetical protein
MRADRLPTPPTHDRRTSVWGEHNARLGENHKGAEPRLVQSFIAALPALASVFHALDSTGLAPGEATVIRKSYRFRHT